MQLKQVCNFHNHVSAEILPCQKLLLLNPAVRFEQLFSSDQSFKRMQWDSADQLEAFTIRVKDGAAKLRGLNRQLRIAHAKLCETVVSIML